MPGAVISKAINVEPGCEEQQMAYKQVILYHITHLHCVLILHCLLSDIVM